MTPINDVIPLLAYSDIQAAHDFLVDVFGFESVEVERLDDGTVVHGEVLAGTTRIWLHEVGDGGLSAASTLPSASGGTVVLVEDVDEHHEHARESGANIESAPSDQPYGYREYTVRDLDGHLWWFSTPL